MKVDALKFNIIYLPEAYLGSSVDVSNLTSADLNYALIICPVLHEIVCACTIKHFHSLRVTGISYLQKSIIFLSCNRRQN